MKSAQRGARPSLVWHAYPLGLLGALPDATAAGRSVRDLAAWLPHLRSLSVDTVLLGPVFESVSHGYDTIDHRRIDRRIGGCDADLVDFVKAAGQVGISVVLDGVFAFTSRQFWRIHDPAESDSAWFQHDQHGEMVQWRVDSLVTPDYGSAEYQAYVADVMISWLDRGVAGWRLDSAWSVPTAFWRRVLTRVRLQHPDAWFLAQVFADDVPTAVNAAGYTTATEYPLMHGLRTWLAGGHVAAAAQALELHARNSAGHRMFTFLGNHDFAHLADVVPYRNLAAAFAVLLTLPGVPAIYYGDEFALQAPDWISGGGDHLLRPPLAVGAIDQLRPAPSNLMASIRQLGKVRRDRPWLTDCPHVTVLVANPDSGYLSYEVQTAEHRLAVAINPSATTVHEPPIPGVLVTGDARTNGPLLEFPPGGWAIHDLD